MEIGAAIGGVVVVESLFLPEKDTSKNSRSVLIAHRQAWGFRHVHFQFACCVTDAWTANDEIEFGRRRRPMGPPPTV